MHAAGVSTVLPPRRAQESVTPMLCQWHTSTERRAASAASVRRTALIASPALNGTVTHSVA